MSVGCVCVLGGQLSHRQSAQRRQADRRPRDKSLGDSEAEPDSGDVKGVVGCEVALTGLLGRIKLRN